MADLLSSNVTEKLNSGQGEILLNILLEGLNTTNILLFVSKVFIIISSIAILIILKEVAAGVISCYSNKIKVNQFIRIE